jgi:hypothetical protein
MMPRRARADGARATTGSASEHALRGAERAVRAIEGDVVLSEAPKAYPDRQTLILDGYPTPEQATMLGPNRGSRRWGVAATRAEIQGRVAIEAHAQGIVAVRPPVHITYRYVVPTRTHRDWDNYALIAKPCQDGLVKAGILIGGDHFDALTATVVFQVVKGMRRLEIVIAPAEQARDGRAGGGD